MRSLYASDTFGTFFDPDFGQNLGQDLDSRLAWPGHCALQLFPARIPGSRGSILRVDADGKSLRCAANGRLPAEYCREIDGIAIGPDVGCCAVAAYRRETVIAEDIATDPLCQRHKSLAARFGLRSNWSTPACGAFAA